MLFQRKSCLNPLWFESVLERSTPFMIRQAIVLNFSALQRDHNSRNLVSDQTECNRAQSRCDYAQRSSNRETFQPIGIESPTYYTACIKQKVSANKEIENRTNLKKSRASLSSWSTQMSCTKDLDDHADKDDWLKVLEGRMYQRPSQPNAGSM